MTKDYINITLADDDEDDRLFFTDAFEELKINTRVNTFKDGVEKLSDLTPGMLLEGVITNVTNFGAFVDIGVHQDGLVHISSLTDKFVSDPHQVVKAGDIVKVKVLEVDQARKRIALTMRMDEQARSNGDTNVPTAGKGRPERSSGSNKTSQTPKQEQGNAAMGNALAAALAKFKK